MIHESPVSPRMQSSLSILLISALLLGLCLGAEQRPRRDLASIDLERVRKAVIDPSSISNQATGNIAFNYILNPLGYAVTGKFFLQ